MSSIVWNSSKDTTRVRAAGIKITISAIKPRKLPRDLVIAFQPLGADTDYLPLEGTGSNMLGLH